MGERTRYVVQGFEHVEGRLVATSRLLAQNESHALRQAEAVARRAAGAVALRYVGPDPAASDAISGATVLGAFGDVPDALADGLAGG